MESTSTLEPTAMIAASFTSSDSVAQDVQARNTLTDGDAYDKELRPAGLRRLGLGFRRVLAGLKRGLGNTFSGHHDQGSGDNLREALVEGRRQVSEVRRAARRATCEARAQLRREKREIRAARRRGLLAQQANIFADSAGARLDRHTSSDGDGDLQREHVTNRGEQTIRGIGPAFHGSST